jgi:hypothetical protein
LSTSDSTETTRIYHGQGRQGRPRARGHYFTKADRREQAANMVVTLPWPGADPVHLTTCAHIVAVILYACQLCPNWRTSWTYHYQHLKQHYPHGDNNDNGSNNKRNRVVPWNAQQFPRLVGNGSTVAGYLDFYEETLRDADQTLAPDFVNMLDTSTTHVTTSGRRRRRICSDDDNDGDGDDGDDGADEWEHDSRRVVRPCTQLAGVQRPLQEQQPQETKPRPTKKERKPAKTTKKTKTTKNASQQEPTDDDAADTVKVGRLVFHPSNLDVDQNLLLEFLAYTSRLDATWILDAYTDIFSTKYCNSLH